MRITKFPQSCLLVETKGRKILVDPGNLKYRDEYFDIWNSVDIVLITHKHGDHIKQDAIEKINKPIYSTKEVQDTYPNLKINIVKEGDTLEFDDIKVEVVKAIHGYNPLLKGDKEVKENVGYIIDDGIIRFYTTSDTICFNNNYKCDVVALPITAHGLTMSSYEAALYSKELGAKLVIPVHMDNDFYPTNIKYMKDNFKKFDINYKVLDIEETIEI